MDGNNWLAREQEKQQNLLKQAIEQRDLLKQAIDDFQVWVDTSEKKVIPDESKTVWDNLTLSDLKFLHDMGIDIGDTEAK